ncbi:MAG: hypothetical protein Q8Q09_29135 [Deltaproteobacteria bacterium]|nr:hypothetical protein [Deltaproteobacteria bacterium]
MTDPKHWLYHRTPRQWLTLGRQELERGRAAFSQRDRKGALTCCRRAAGMALNGVLATQSVPDLAYGQTYMDHVLALQSDLGVPERVRSAAQLLVQTPLPGASIVVLRTIGSDERIVEATRDVLAHCYAMVIKSEPDPDDSDEALQPSE